jgi:hypothetical protein
LRLKEDDSSSATEISSTLGGEDFLFFTLAVLGWDLDDQGKIGLFGAASTSVFVVEANAGYSFGRDLVEWALWGSAYALKMAERLGGGPKFRLVSDASKSDTAPMLRRPANGGGGLNSSSLLPWFELEDFAAFLRPKGSRSLLDEAGEEARDGYTLLLLDFEGELRASAGWRLFRPLGLEGI